MVEAEIALEPNNAPDEDAAKLMVLKYAVTVVPPVIFKPTNGLAAFAAGVVNDPMRLLKTEIVVPALIKIPFTVEDALLPDIL